MKWTGVLRQWMVAFEMLAAASVALLVAMSLTLLRAVRGPTVYDRILAVNMFGTMIVLMIAVFGFLTHRPDFLDIAIIYALINFVSTIAVLKFFEYGDMGRSATDEDEVDA